MTASSTNQCQSNRMTACWSEPINQYYHPLQNSTLNGSRTSTKTRYSRSDKRKSEKESWTHWHFQNMTLITQAPRWQLINGIPWNWKSLCDLHHYLDKLPCYIMKKDLINYMSDRGLVSKNSKELKINKLISRKQIIPIKIKISREFSKDKPQMDKKYFKNCSLSFIIRNSKLLYASSYTSQKG